MELSQLLTGEYEQIEVIRDGPAGVLAFLVIHNTRMGPAFGGIRRLAYGRPAEAVADALRLAEAMTLKCAISGIPGGGGKTVLMQAPDLDRRAAYRLIGRFVEQMGGRYYTGPDVGTDADDLAAVASATRFVARPGADGPGNLAEPTALGVFAGLRTVARRLGFDGLGGVHVLVQGLGEIGLRLARQLSAAGARLTVSDIRRDVVEDLARGLDVEAVEPGDILGVKADIFAPCALGGVVHDLSIERLEVRAIAGCANNVLSEPRHGAALFERGVLYAPDFVISSGALIHGAMFHLEGQAPPPERIEQIGSLLDEVFDRAEAEGRPPDQVAEQMARERIAAAAGNEPFMPAADRPPA